MHPDFLTIERNTFQIIKFDRGEVEFLHRWLQGKVTNSGLHK